MSLKAKGIVKVVLLIFVVGSVGYAINNEFKKSSQSAVAAPTAAVQPEAKSTEPSPQPPSETDSKKKNHQIIAYYFHGNARCQSCLLIEKNTYAAITEKFDKEIKEGALDWRVINIEDPANGHFIQDYNISSKSVVLSLINSGKEQKWKISKRCGNTCAMKSSFMPT